MNSTTTGRNGQAIVIALDLAARGWHVFPVHVSVNGVCSCSKKENCPSNKQGKHPATRNGFMDATADAAILRKKWPSRWRNIGIRTGKDSNLLVIDVDPRNGGNETFEKLAKELGPLPETLSVKTGGGGYHYYLNFPKELSETKPSVSWPGVDIQGEGAFVIAPPSIHSSGRGYRWANNAPIADVPTSWLLAMLKGMNTGCIGHAGISGSSANTGDSRAISQGAVASEIEQKVATLVGQIIQEGLPNGPGQRHNSLFRVGRRCKAIAELESKTAEQTVWIADQFYNQLEARIGSNNINASLLDNQVEWLDIWDDIKYPGDEAVAHAWKVALEYPPLACATGLLPVWQRAVRMFKLLSLQQDGHFFISNRLLANVVGLKSHVTAWNMLKRMEKKHGIIKRISVGELATKQASVFQYLGD